MRVVHITPTYFDKDSIIGGGERYPSELAQWMSRKTQTTLVSFSRRRHSQKRGDLAVEIYPARHLLQNNKCNPLSLRFIKCIAKADVVHVHSLFSMVSDISCLVASILKKPVFVTDYGGGGGRVLSGYLPVFKKYTAGIAYSEFGLAALPDIIKSKSATIKGGIDNIKFSPNYEKKKNHILFVGRLLPHKGVNDLIEAFRLLRIKDGYRLRIVGRIYDRKFYEHLIKISNGLNVDYLHDLDDQHLVEEYRSAKVTVLPSVHTTMYDHYSPIPELMGFTLLESQACGTPVVCTTAGAMSEFLNSGVTGFVSEQNSPESLAEAIQRVVDLDDHATTKCCTNLAAELNWEKVVDKHLQLYTSERKAS